MKDSRLSIWTTLNAGRGATRCSYGVSIVWRPDVRRNRARPPRSGCTRVLPTLRNPTAYDVRVILARVFLFSRLRFSCTRVFGCPRHDACRFAFGHARYPRVPISFPHLFVPGPFDFSLRKRVSERATGDPTREPHGPRAQTAVRARAPRRRFGQNGAEYISEHPPPKSAKTLRVHWHSLRRTV